MAAKDKKLEWKIGSVIIIAFFALIIGLIFSYFYVGSPKEMISIADQFKPGSDWQLTQSTVEPPRNSCIDTVCPSLSRAWLLPKKIDKQKFEDIAWIGNTHLAPSKSCFEKNDNGDTIESCDATGTLNGYDITLSYSGSGYPDDKPSILLYIQK